MAFYPCLLYVFLFKFAIISFCFVMLLLNMAILATARGLVVTLSTTPIYDEVHFLVAFNCQTDKVTFSIG